MIKLTIVSSKGIVFDDNVKYLVVEGNNGQLGIMNNHIPVVVPIKNGFVKAVMVEDDNETFYALSGAMLEFSNNIATIITQEVANGDSVLNAKQALDTLRQKQKSENHRKLMDFTEMEKELALNIKEIKPSKLKFK